jgi:hypothetical protein
MARTRWLTAAHLGLLLTVSAAEMSPPAARGSCRAADDHTGYRIRTARLEDPWRLLRLNWWLEDGSDTAVAALAGTPYSSAALDKAQEVIESDRFLPADSSSYATFNYFDAGIENCDPAAKELDVVFRVFSARVSPVLSTTFEFREKEQSNGPEARGSDEIAPFRLMPLAGYNRSERLFAGGRAEGRWTAGRFPLERAILEGYGSTSAHSVEAALSGSYDSTSWLAHSEWRLAFLNSSRPAADSRLSQGWLALQVSGTTKPAAGAVFRFGAAAEGGNLQTRFAPSELASDTLASAGYSSAKAFIGVTAHPPRQAIAVSYGIGFGSIGAGLRGDWRKHIGDVAYDFSLPADGHRLFEFEQRLTTGGIEILRSVPAAARFFGGNREEFFIPGDTWKIRANPVIRSIPANRFYRTSAGAGADRFVSYNSTAAFTVWGRPVVPQELTSDNEFKNQLNSSLTASTSFLDVAYRSKDPHFGGILNLLPDVKKSLDALVSAAEAAKPSIPAALSGPFDDCLSAAGDSQTLVNGAVRNKPARAYGSVKELLRDGDSPLATVVSACQDTLNASLNNPAIAAEAKSLTGFAATIETEFAAIDNNAAAAKAKSDMAYARRALNTILDEMNIVSISPVIVFDAARLAPSGTDPYGGFRYGLGGGIRLSLVNSISLTAGYAWNPDRRPREGPGAFFFALETRNLFQ